MNQSITKHQRVFGLDVLRAFAILMVLALHSSPWISTRFTWFYEFVRHYDGVTIFFCLSGFLIGGILIKTLENKGPHVSNLWDFWLRRWIRTVPPYLLVLPVVMLLEILHGVPAKTYLPYFVFLQNFNWPMPAAFQESWSLTVEEWFYLLSAPASFLLAKLLKPRYGVLVAAVLFLLSSTLYRYQCFQHYQPTSLQQWDDHFRKIVLLRLDSLMYGIVAAWVAQYYPTAWLQAKWPLFVLGFISLSLIASPLMPTDFTQFTCVFAFSVAAFGVACMLPLLSSWRQGSGPVASAVTHTSLISYSLYLVHATIVNTHIALPLALSLLLPSQVKSLVGLSTFWVVSFALATLMYKYFEVPVMALRSRLK